MNAAELKHKVRQLKNLEIRLRYGALRGVHQTYGAIPGYKADKSITNKK